MPPKLPNVPDLRGLLPRGRRAIGVLAACLAAGGLAGWLLVPAKGGITADPHPPEIKLGGAPLSLDGDRAQVLDRARALARAYLAEAIEIELPGAGKRSATREELGARVDPARLERLVDELKNPKSALRRDASVTPAGKPLDVPMPVAIDAEKGTYALLQLKDEVDRPAVDARYDHAGGKVTPDEPGVRVDVFGTLARIDDALAKGERKATAVTEALKAQRTTDQVQGLDFSHVLGYFETKYARDLKHEARTFNLKLAASRLDGHVVFPGEVFDFNEVVGPRTEANGYKVATVIAQGELVDGIGGGTCQIAGTLHSASFFAGLDIVERKPHTRPSFYIKMGMDSTVVYPTITFKLKNPYDFPVVLHEKVEGGVVRAEILGPKPRTRDVTFVRKINEVVPFREKEVDDPKVPKGERVLAQRGIPGFRITRYRILRDGPFAVREKTVDQYPAVTQIWHVGTGDPNPKFEARDDEHPEYVADEYLMVSQGPNVKSTRGDVPVDKGGATVESRVAGKYGSYGWTVKAGFSKPFTRDKKRAGAQPGEDDRPGTD